MKMLPLHCPSCGVSLTVERLRCQACGTDVGGSYVIPALASLSRDNQNFVRQFVKTGGSFREMARIMGVSYPTVRNRLDVIIEKLGEIKTEGKE